MAAELRRWDVEVDDSAGRPLSHTPPGTLLCLLADAVDSGFAPVPLLALLKHPLSTLGGDGAAFREKARELDLLLRGPRPDSGLDGVRAAIQRERANAGQSAQARLSRLLYWFADVAAALEPLETALGKSVAKLEDIVAAHLKVAEALAGNALWTAEAGEVASRFVAELIEAAPGIEINNGAYAALFRKLAATKAVRLQRSGHPRVAILGPLEARLQNFDTVVLGGLNEGAGAHAAGRSVVLATDAQGAGAGTTGTRHRTGGARFRDAGRRRARGADAGKKIGGRADGRVALGGTAVATDRRVGIADKAARCFEAGYRLCGFGTQPRRSRDGRYPRSGQRRAHRLRRGRRGLSVTEIERWIRDPYAIYARRVLRLDVLDPLDTEIGPLERGNAVHKALERFVKETSGPLGDDAALTLIAIADQVFAAEGTPKAALALWRPALRQCGVWFVDMERTLRDARETSLTEVKGHWQVTPDFELRGIADRIDILHGGTGAIFDYKTGKPPTGKQIKAFLAPQLLLEAEMLRQGAFGDPREAEALTYVWFSGGRDPGALETVAVTLVPEAVARLKRYIALFEKETTPYLPRLRPLNVKYAGDYDHLARVREWSLGGWEAPDE